jgi:ATP-dependent Lon protease
VLDPEQNNTFRDNYLGVPFDLSRVVFLTTANMLDTVPGPLRDRMEIISLAGYTAEEKFQIARRYLVGRQMEANGLKEGPGRDRRRGAAATSSSTIPAKPACGTSSARSARRCATPRCASPRARPRSIRITPATISAILGSPQFENEVAMRTSVPGVATGLAWTPVGGDILFIEATRIPGSGKLILTGQLGDVMRESAQAALSIVKNRAESLGIDEKRFEKADITCTCRPAPSPRTARAPAWPCSWRWCR